MYIIKYNFQDLRIIEGNLRNNPPKLKKLNLHFQKTHGHLTWEGGLLQGGGSEYKHH